MKNYLLFTLLQKMIFIAGPCFRSFLSPVGNYSARPCLRLVAEPCFKLYCRRHVYMQKAINTYRYTYIVIAMAIITTGMLKITAFIFTVITFIIFKYTVRTKAHKITVFIFVVIMFIIFHVQ